MNSIVCYFSQEVNIGYNLSMNIKAKIKILTAARGITLKQLAEKLSETTNKDYTYNSLLGKLNRESLSLKEADLIARILNYKLEFTDLYKG